MRLLLDNCIGKAVEDVLIRMGHDVQWATGPQQKCEDRDILAMALEADRVLVTQDADFGQLSVHHEQPHCGILQFKRMRPPRQVQWWLEFLAEYKERLEWGSLVIVAQTRTLVKSDNRKRNGHA